MEIFFVQLLYFLRPMLNAELVTWRFLGFSFFELAALLLFLLLAASFSLKLLHKSRDPVSGVELWAALLIVWCTISFFVHIEISRGSDYVKLILPLVTYILIKRILPDRSAHIRMIFLMLIGFLLPFVISAVMTYQGEGLGKVIYWTGTERYKGVYDNIHNMGHNAGFAMMLAIIYLAIKRSQKLPLHWAEQLVLAAVFFIGVYLLYATQTRNVYLGVLLFFFVTLFLYSKRALAVSVIVAIVFVAYFWDAVSTIFFDFVDPQYTGEQFERAGSGRLSMWTSALEAWREAPLLHQITGMGIAFPGHRTAGPGSIEATVAPWGDPHNDWLFALMALGWVGLTIFVGLFASIFQAILKIPGKEKFAFLGLLAAVVMMNAFSNAYISRTTMAQLFFMLIVYVDLRSVGPSNQT